MVPPSTLEVPFDATLCPGREPRDLCEFDLDGLKQALTKIYDDLVPHVGPEFSAHAKTWAESL